MVDPRIEKLAHNLINHSIELKSGENVMIEVRGDGNDLARALVKEAYKVGGYPHVRVLDPLIQREILMQNSEGRAQFQKKWDEPMWKDMQAFIAIQGLSNTFEYADVPREQLLVGSKVMKPVTDYIINNVRWVGLNYPNVSQAAKARMSMEAFEDFYYEVCTMDYSKMGEAFQPLKELMERTDQVRLVGEGTDLTFSIKDIPAVICSGEKNIPDGEIYTAPVRDSVNGTITFNATTHYRNTDFQEIKLTFENGKIVEATANNTEKLLEILDTDEGARYVGEFAIAANPYILHPMNDILFDEKIAGSFHFTPGQAYEDADNGNRSQIHWDMVNIQRPDYGGGEIWFDGVLIRKDGLFVLDELKGLNPENLKG
ncbi:MAG TPA: aminopeptidase [Bacilli bacterium]|nr:aminopeptidase [Bacilli bacterium]